MPGQQRCKLSRWSKIEQKTAAISLCSYEVIATFVWNKVQKASSQIQPKSLTMSGNPFKAAVRNIRKGKVFSIINIFGLAMGLSACLLIALFVVDEFSYDQYNVKADRIFRVVYDAHLNGNAFVGNYAPFPMGPTLVSEYPPIEKAVRIRYEGNILVGKGNEKEIESNAVLADSTLFDIFSLPMIAGDAHKALAAPYSMVISERIAKKYFNSTAVIGKTLVTYGNLTYGSMDTTTYQIRGVMKDIPAASHFHFDIIKSMAEKHPRSSQQWVNPYCPTYLLARPGVTAKDVDRMLGSAVAKYVAPQLEQQTNSNLEEMTKHGDYFREYSIPLPHIHLYSNVLGEFESNGSIETVRIFMVIAILILLIACVNFMNLATARSADRSREVGVRKVLGASRENLIVGFLLEAILTSLVSLLLAIGITALLLPYFNQLSGKDFHIDALGKNGFLIAFLSTPIALGLLAGSYPALYLSAAKPINVLKGHLALGFRSGWFRNILVVFQFAIAIALIIGTLVIYSQLNYIHHQDVGYNRDQVLTVLNTNSLGNQAEIFRDEVQKLPGIVGSTMTGDLPNKVRDGAITYYKDPSAKGNEAYLLHRWSIDHQYIPLLGMKMVIGRNFSPNMQTDSAGILINETAALLLGYSEPINKPLYRGPGPENAFHILGVVKDFNEGTLHDKVEPIVFQLGANRHAVSFRIRTDNIPALIAAIRERYHSMDRSKGQPFEYSFMDDTFNKQYLSDQHTGQIFISFSLFAIFIACLGLFGLVTYAAEVRTKEIGIRKVLGASVSQIVGLMSADFLKLVFLASAIACPIAWWSMHIWLQDFAYRTTIGWWIFLLSTVLAALIALLTVCFRAIKAAIANPIYSLRTD
jgi:putative ABC transport system permease protein